MRALLLALALTVGCYVQDTVAVSYPYGACELQASPVYDCEVDYYWVRGYVYYDRGGRRWWRDGHYVVRPGHPAHRR